MEKGRSYEACNACFPAPITLFLFCPVWFFMKLNFRGSPGDCSWMSRLCKGQMHPDTFLPGCTLNTPRLGPIRRCCLAPELQPDFHFHFKQVGCCALDVFRFEASSVFPRRANLHAAPYAHKHCKKNKKNTTRALMCILCVSFPLTSCKCFMHVINWVSSSLEWLALLAVKR